MSNLTEFREMGDITVAIHYNGNPDDMKERVYTGDLLRRN